MSSLKKNIGYQTFYQILSTCIPLITSPYLARTLGAKSQGIFSFTQSIANYFVLFAALGVINYGSRAIAICKNDKKERGIVFWEIYTFQFISSMLSLILYLVYLIFFCKANILIAYIQGIAILSACIDISWLFFGAEQFRITVTRNTIIKVITVLLIIFLVKKPSDLWIYALIMTIGTFSSNFLLWWFVPRTIEIETIKRIHLIDCKKHIKSNLVLFIPLLAMSVFHVMDKTMLGLLSTYEQTGYYYNADKVINIPIGIISGIGTVMLPRTTAMIENGDDKGAFALFENTLELIVAISSAMAFGIAAISSVFTPLFFGDGFDECVRLIVFLAPVLVIKAMSQTSRMQYLIPNHKESVFIQSVIAGAIINLVVNYILISKYGAIGAVIGTLSAELLVCVWQYIMINRYDRFNLRPWRLVIYLILGAIMLFGVKGMSKVLYCLNISNTIIILLAEILCGAIVYSIMCVCYWKITKSDMLQIISRYTKIYKIRR